MKELKRAAILLALIKELEDKGSWCGETHIQKATYFLEELMDVPLDLDFILYKHGPYSFELSDEIAVMRAKNFLAVQSQPYPYGPSIVPGENAEIILDRFPKTLEKHKSKIDFIATKLAKMKVTELERLATAFYVTKKNDKNKERRATRINELKPHISKPEAQKAIEDVDILIRESKGI